MHQVSSFGCTICHKDFICPQCDKETAIDATENVAQAALPVINTLPCVSAQLEQTVKVGAPIVSKPVDLDIGPLVAFMQRYNLCKQGTPTTIEDVKQILAANWSGVEVRNVLRSISIAYPDEAARRSCLEFLLTIPDKTSNVRLPHFNYTNNELLFGLCVQAYATRELYTK